MDIKEYISSGILELYAAGSLSEPEAKEVEAMAASHAEVRAELDAINSALTGYASAFKKNPRPEMRQNILDKIDEIEGSSKPVSTNVYRMPDSAPVKEDYSRVPSKMKYMMAAVLAFLVLNVAANYYLLTKWKSTENQMTAIVNENAKMKQEYEQIKSTLDKKSGDMKMVMNRNNKVVDLKGMEISPSSQATVYWNPNSKQVMLSVDNLPAPPPDKQYQLWALKDGKPIDAGVFDMDKDPMHPMTIPIGAADAFAVTLETKGGSPAPTLTQRYVMGKI
jgi:hypothetical protein